MDKKLMIQHWNYCCSVSEMLASTEKYVYHGIYKNENGELELLNKNTFSDAFKQIIIISAVEFEALLRDMLSDNEKNICGLSKEILNKYPKIIETEIYSKYFTFSPLSEWKMVEVSSNDKVEGLDWWKVYTDNKHNNEDSFKMATLENALNAVGSLYILNLYNVWETEGNLHWISSFSNGFFKCNYGDVNCYVSGKSLPGVIIENE